jgi:D-alanyl-lipoteichoic acid acyltransferase DltB (MBOAT superfamily)
MIFNSVTYLVFLVVVVGLYWALPKRPRLWMIFLSSVVFYGFWRWQYVFLMLFSAGTDYFIALQMEKTEDNRSRRLLLLASLVVNLGLLVYFKYLLFFAANAVSLLNFIGVDTAPPEWSIILPLGISFYTFQTISYSVDVYRRFRKPEKDFVLYGCFVTFFPQLVAGPILRAGDLVEQLANRPCFRADDIAKGLRRLLFGLFLKVVLADNVASVVDDGYAQNIELLHALDVWTLAFLFGFQIYFDFSGYSHIAIGSALLMGIHLPENFNFPYLSVSPREFWKRWHISLSSWIRDYLYLPLCGVKVVERSRTGAFAGELSVSETRKSVALFLTWGIMGLWHGAAWTFVLWGLIHATLIYLHRKITVLWPGNSIWRSGIGWCMTLPLAMLAWVSFRARGLDQALAMYAKVFRPGEYLERGLRENTYLIAALLLLCVLVVYGVRRWIAPLTEKHPLASVVAETPIMAVATGLVFVFLRPISQFIYFQF